MFKNKPPKIFAHMSALNRGNYVTNEYILSKGEGEVNLLSRFCPHRMYPLHNVGDHVKEITCNFHGFKWKQDGTPLNNRNKLYCGSAIVGSSGLLFKNFSEPDHKWVNDLTQEQNLRYSHNKIGHSKGSWLWMMEIQVDLLHIRKGQGAIHPDLSSVTNLDEVVMEAGDGWVLQTSSTGWWLFIYPYTFIEHSKGCMAINTVTPKDENNEFGFEWTTQFYYDPSVHMKKREEFETLEAVFIEDVGAIELQKGPWFPLTKAESRLEQHCVHWGNWVKKNKDVRL